MKESTVTKEDTVVRTAIGTVLMLYLTLLISLLKVIVRSDIVYSHLFSIINKYYFVYSGDLYSTLKNSVLSKFSRLTDRPREICRE